MLTTAVCSTFSCQSHLLRGCEEKKSMETRHWDVGKKRSIKKRGRNKQKRTINKKEVEESSVIRRFETGKERKKERKRWRKKEVVGVQSPIGTRSSRHRSSGGRRWRVCGRPGRWQAITTLTWTMVPPSRNATDPPANPCRHLPTSSFHLSLSLSLSLSRSVYRSLSLAVLWKTKSNPVLQNTIRPFFEIKD